MIDLATIPTIHALTFGGPGNLPVARIVIHRAECPMERGRARAVAGYFRSPAAGVSAHYVVDPGETIRCLDDDEIGIHAPPNRHSIGIELAGYSEDSDWGIPDGHALLERAAQLVAALCRVHQVPAQFITARALLAGERGITTHLEVGRAWKRTTHTDPGEAFPMGAFLDMVRLAREAT